VNRVGKGAGSCSDAGQNAAAGGESLVTATARDRTDVADDVVLLSLECGSGSALAGGIGITPILPMIETVATRGVPWRLVYGGRRRS
jgi:hypothetical protein